MTRWLAAVRLGELGPRCGRPMRPRRGPAKVLSAADPDAFCGRPPGHSPPCRSLAALAGYAARQAERRAA